MSYALQSLKFPLLFLCILINTDHTFSQERKLYPFIDGNKLYYNITYQSDSKSDFSSLFTMNDSIFMNPNSASAHYYFTRLSCRLTIQALSEQQDTAITLFTFIDPFLELKIDSIIAKSQIENIINDLRSPVYVKINQNGRFCSLLLNPTMSNYSVNLIKALVAQIQVILPEDISLTSIKRWDVIEEDPNGYCNVAYSLMNSDSSISSRSINFKKQKTSYISENEPTKQDNTEIPVVVYPKGFLEGEYDIKSKRLSFLRGTEKQIITIAGNVVATADNKIDLVMIDQFEPDTFVFSNPLETYLSIRPLFNESPLSFETSDEESEAIIHRNELGDDSLDSLLMRLETLEREGKKRDLPLYLKLRALVYLNPEVCNTLCDLLLSAKPSGLTMNVISSSLSNIGHPQAQIALLCVLRGKSNDFVAMQKLIYEIGLLRNPQDYTIESLIDLYDENTDENIDYDIIITLGNNARSLSSGKPVLADKIIDRIISEMNIASTEARKHICIMALGNAGSVKAFPLIEKQLETSSSENILSASLFALRWMNTSKVDTLLINVLKNNPDFSLRFIAVESLSYREPNTFLYNEHTYAFASEKNEIIRQKILDNLFGMRMEFPQVSQFFRTIAINDPSEKIRESISIIVEKYFNK